MKTYYRVELVIFKYNQGDDEDDLTWDMEEEEVVSIHDTAEEAYSNLCSVMTMILHDEDRGVK